jgi:hypothetical protein
MEIEEYRPEPPRPLPPAPKRRDLSTLTMIGIFTGVFLTTLAVENRHEIMPAARQILTKPAISNAPAPMPAAIRQPPLAPAPSLANIERMEQCISTQTLSAGELQQVTEALRDQAKSPTPPASPALNGTLDLQSITTQQAAEFTGMLMAIGGEIGEKAQQAFQQDLTDGICKLVPQAPASLPAPRWPSQP